MFLKNPTTQHSIFIQGVASDVFLVLQADAMGLLLAASVVKALGWRNVSFFTDCQTLADAAEARNLLDNPGHRRIRPILVDFFNRASCLNSFRVSHIPRVQNLLVHSLNKKAFLCRSSNCSSYLCSKASRCNFRMAYEAIDFPMGELLSIHCLGC